MPVIQEETEDVDQQMPTLHPVVQINQDERTTETTVELLPNTPANSETTDLTPRVKEEQNTSISVELQEPEDSNSSPPIICAACHLAIKERYLLQASDHYWHEDCLKCSCCDCRLGEVGSSLYTKANLLLCKRDYLR